MTTEENGGSGGGVAQAMRARLLAANVLMRYDYAWFVLHYHISPLDERLWLTSFFVCGCP